MEGRVAGVVHGPVASPFKAEGGSFHQEVEFVYPVRLSTQYFVANKFSALTNRRRDIVFFAVGVILARQSIVLHFFLLQPLLDRGPVQEPEHHRP